MHRIFIVFTVFYLNFASLTDAKGGKAKRSKYFLDQNSFTDFLVIFQCAKYTAKVFSKKATVR